MALVQILPLLFPFIKSSQTDHFSTIGSSGKKYEQKKQQRKTEEREEEWGVALKAK